jgi:hypothetical protein
VLSLTEPLCGSLLHAGLQHSGSPNTRMIRYVFAMRGYESVPLSPGRFTHAGPPRCGRQSACCFSPAAGSATPGPTSLSFASGNPITMPSGSITIRHAVDRVCGRLSFWLRERRLGLQECFIHIGTLWGISKTLCTRSTQTRRVALRLFLTSRLTFGPSAAPSNASRP